jgi:hypothetical protein
MMCGLETTEEIFTAELMSPKILIKAFSILISIFRRATGISVS